MAISKDFTTEIRDQYLTLNDRQKNENLGTFLDFVSFYWLSNTWEEIYPFADNLNISLYEKLTIIRYEKFLMISTVYNDFIIPIARIDTFKMTSWKWSFKRIVPFSRCSVYWKGLYVMRQNKEIIQYLLDFLQTIMPVDALKLSRLDITTDIPWLDFSIKCSLDTSKGNTRYNPKTHEVQTKYFGKKTGDIYIRYYDKTAELKEKWFSFLYPEYQQHDKIMRYEIVLKTKAIPKIIKDKYCKIGTLPQLFEGLYMDEENKEKLNLARQSHRNSSYWNAYKYFDQLISGFKGKFDTEWKEKDLQEIFVWHFPTLYLPHSKQSRETVDDFLSQELFEVDKMTPDQYWKKRDMK